MFNQFTKAPAINNRGRSSSIQNEVLVQKSEQYPLLTPGAKMEVIITEACS